MNYVILNNKKSTEVKGLLIQQLPPITKPLIRTQVEEIDGRDGDIVTPLGYSAYDKEISVGLRGDYDVDAAIAFFDSEGEVVFSNEPDKYYNYQITDAIDFERLIRFRTANVRFHVQPFKYATVDRKFTFNVSSGKSISVINRGNTFSKPKITIYGSGLVKLSVNGTLILQLAVTDYMTIDAAQMNAYREDVFMNRYVEGSYENLRLKPGTNTISWTGTVTKVEVEDFSRWI